MNELHEALWAKERERRRLTAKANHLEAVRQASLQQHQKSQDELENNPEVWKMPIASAPPSNPDREASKRVQLENYNREIGDTVAIKFPQTLTDGLVGKVLDIYWRGDELMASVEVDLLDPDDRRWGHYAHREMRFRPSFLAPVIYQLPADQLMNP